MQGVGKQNCRILLVQLVGFIKAGRLLQFLANQSVGKGVYIGLFVICYGCKGESCMEILLQSRGLFARMPRT